MIEERKRLEAMLVEFRGFLGSPVHREYKAATASDLAAIEARILEDDITSLPDFLTLLDLRAQRRVLKSALTSFEDTAVTLDARIAEMKRNEDTKTTAQQETDETDEQE